MEYSLKPITSKNQWERFIDNVEYITPIMSWAWGEFEHSTGATFERLGFYRANKLIALVQYKVIKARRGKFISIRHGPIANWNKLALRDIKALILQLRLLGKQKHVWAIRFQPYWPKDDTKTIEILRANGVIQGTSHLTDAELSVQIDLTKSLDEIIASFRKTTRHEIKKAQKLGVEIKIFQTMNMWNSFAEIFKDTVKRQKWGAMSLNIMKKQYEIFSKEGLSKMFIAYYRKVPIAGAIFTFYKNMVMYHHSGSLSSHTHISAMHLIQMKLIEYAKKHGYKLYDLWGTAPRNAISHPWRGLSMFKWGFSKNEVKFMHAQDIIVNPIWHFVRLYERFESRKWG